MYDPGQLYVDPILTGFSVGFQDQTLIGELIFPVVPVRTQSGRYRVFDRSNWVTFPDRREPGTVANEVRGRKWSEDTFFTKEHSLQAAVHDEERQELTSLGGLANPVFGGALTINPERDATELITRAILLRHELKASTIARDTSNYPAGFFDTLSGTEQWDDYTLVGSPLEAWQTVSDPVADIRAGIQKIWFNTQRYPNLLVIPMDAVMPLETHPRIIRRFENFSLLEPNAFQRLTGFEGRIVISNSRYNAADNIDAAEDITSFWEQDVWLGVADDGLAENTQTFGKTFSQIYPDGSIRPTENWREEPRKSSIVRTSQKYDLKVVSNIAGYLLKDVVTPVS